MAIQADFHLHSNFSGDSSAPMEDMIQKAISLGLTHICITEHYDPDYIYLAGQDAIFELNTDSYLYELLRLRDRYKDKISVGFGVELGLQPHLKRELAVFSKSKEFDFIIGSSHLCNRKDPYYPEFFEGRSEEEAHREYLRRCLPVFKNCLISMSMGIWIMWCGMAQRKTINIRMKNTPIFLIKFLIPCWKMKKELN